MSVELADGAADLVVEDLSVRYGQVTAVNGLSLTVPKGSIVAVLGANGAGKTSTMRALAGSLKATVNGRAELFGESILGRHAHRVAARGMVLVPEGRQVIAPLSVEENLLLGAHRQRSRSRVRELLHECHELFPILHERASSPAGLLSGGEQQMLAFGRALMADPRLILMDEPSMGLAPVMVDRVMEAVRALNQRGASILMVEQNAASAFGVASLAYVLDQGRIVCSGTSAQVSADPVVAQAFLGLRERPESAEQQLASARGSEARASRQTH